MAGNCFGPNRSFGPQNLLVEGSVPKAIHREKRLSDKFEISDLIILYLPGEKFLIAKMVISKQIFFCFIDV